MLVERLFDSREAMLDALQEACLAALQEGLDARGEATLMASGGSTPEVLYSRLSQVDLDWSQVYVALVDERWVDFDHDKSNEAFVARTLRQNLAGEVNLIGMKNEAPGPSEGWEGCEASYQQLAQPFDVTILGLGTDGHTASFFPHAEGLDEALDPAGEHLCSAIYAKPSEVTGACTERMTLSLPGLLRSRELMLLITGEDKLATLRAAQADGDIADMPVRAVLRQEQVPVTVYWAP